MRMRKQDKPRLRGRILSARWGRREAVTWGWGSACSRTWTGPGRRRSKTSREWTLARSKKTSDGCTGTLFRNRLQNQFLIKNCFGIIVVFLHFQNKQIWYLCLTRAYSLQTNSASLPREAKVEPLEDLLLVAWKLFGKLRPRYASHGVEPGPHWPQQLLVRASLSIQKLRTKVRHSWAQIRVQKQSKIHRLCRCSRTRRPQREMIGRGTSRQKQREKSGNAIYSCRRWIRKHQSKQNFFNALIENIFF